MEANKLFMTYPTHPSPTDVYDTRIVICSNRGWGSTQNKVVSPLKKKIYQKNFRSQKVTGTDNNKNAQVRSVGRYIKLQSAEAVYRDVECRCESVDYFNNLIHSK
jgi:DNA-binding beta-propeller fold protein YncE